MPVVKPNDQQLTFLEGLRCQVLESMAQISFLGTVDLSPLVGVRLGVLRSSATQRHGVTRWNVEPSGELAVDVVDLHPGLLNEEWRDYALFVMYHEFLHVLDTGLTTQFSEIWRHNGPTSRGHHEARRSPTSAA